MASVTRKVFVQLADGKLIPLMTVCAENWGKLEAGVRGAPVYIDESGTAVWPEPDARYDLFTITYHGTIG